MAGFTLSRRSFAPFFASAARPGTGVPSNVVVSWMGMAVLFVTAALSVYLAQMSAVATSGYELQRLETERAAWMARNEQLELEIAKRLSLAWVEADAVDRLGMVRAQKSVYVSVQWEAEDDPEASALAASNGRSSGTRPATADTQRPQPGSPDRAIEAVRTWLNVAIAR